jgi:hypothetical protein
MDASGTKQKLLPKLLKWLGATAVGLVLICSSVFYLVGIRASHAPTAIVVSACGDPGPGVRRIRADFGTQFDISEQAFVVHVGAQDMPPGVNYSVTPKVSKALLVITSHDTWQDVENAFPAFSEDMHKRKFRSANGVSVGTDYWGSLKNGERWRFVKFLNRDAAAYLPTTPAEATLFDQIISSACFSPDAHLKR